MTSMAERNRRSAGQNGVDGVVLTSASVNDQGLVLNLSVGTPLMWALSEADGQNGRDGANGQNGVDGVSVTSASVNDQGELVLNLSVGIVNVGLVKALMGRTVEMVQMVKTVRMA